ncbi:alpha/beta fold hydrolase [Rhizobium sp. SL86]|uniref:alpha/beta fold hydrolase n=1 Tax=Rhizobium sp. SL86 TaxID=2995148 RepID=UPI002273A88D|nr:alpha/beta hydrolase [Rhizobium sp. SL86]MCY1666344.1 alpha/beta hydrolase [Rhizobium sp. SL86]
MDGNDIASPALATETGTSIVLVHGAFVDASGWQPVFELLTRQGHEVIVVQNQTLTLEGDVEATQRAITTARHPVVLVGHSYGGAVITEAGHSQKVKSLAYIAAFVPDAGESVALLNDEPAKPGEAKAPVMPPRDGFLLVDPAAFPLAFAADVAPEKTRFMAAAQVPWGLMAATTPVSRAPWKTKPSFYLVATADRMVPPSAQRRMAYRAGASVFEIDSSHAVMLSHPLETANFIATAADVPS